MDESLFNAVLGDIILGGLTGDITFPQQKAPLTKEQVNVLIEVMKDNMSITNIRIGKTTIVELEPYLERNRKMKEKPPKKVTFKE
jgi:hypothetical protein